MTTDPQAMMAYKVSSPMVIERFNRSRYREGDLKRIAGLIATESVVGVGPKTGRISFLRMVVDESEATERIKNLNNVGELGDLVKVPFHDEFRVKQVSQSWLKTAIASSEARWNREYRRRANNATGDHTLEEWHAVLAKYGKKCLRCGLPGDEFPLTKDHVVPLSKGGSNCASNLQPLCLNCNSWKGARDIDFRGQRD